MSPLHNGKRVRRQRGSAAIPVLIVLLGTFSLASAEK